MKRYIDTEIIAKIVFDYWKECERIERIIPVIKRAIIYKSTADVVERKDLDKITETHEKIGYEKGYRDGYAQAIEDVDERREDND